MAKRRKFTPEFKAQVVLEELTGVKRQAEICREHRLSRQVFSRWRAEFVERAPDVERMQIEHLRRLPTWRKLALVGEMNRTVQAMARASASNACSTRASWPWG